MHKVITNTPFQIALLACIAELVSFAASGRACFPVLTARANALGCIFDMWEALLYVQHHLLKVYQKVHRASNQCSMHHVCLEFLTYPGLIS